MKWIARIVTLGLILSVAGCESRRSSAVYDLTREQIRINEEKAAKGDVESASNLALYYDSFDNDGTKFRTWSLRAAELGDITFLEIVYENDYLEYNNKKKKNQVDCEILIRGYWFALRFYMALPNAGTKNDIDSMQNEIAKTGCRSRASE